MAIIKKWEVSCDNCEAVEHPPVNMRSEAVDWIKKRGWRVKVITGDYEHHCLCPSCFDALLKDREQKADKR